MPVRTRYAPSPTGFLHVGGAWNAFFNWLFARHHGGAFVLRIEDTDRSRSTVEYEQAICEDLRWLGIDWDEGPDVGGPYGPYRQTERAGLYARYAEEFLRRQVAYPCYCTPEELLAERRRAEAEHRPPRYSGRCRNLDEGERARLEAEGRKPALRFHVERFRDPALRDREWLQEREGRRVVVVQDLIRGEVVFDLAELDDFIIVRSDGTPLYNFANVVDDHTMGITHVLRGVEHLVNTPRQLLMYHALGWEPPVFAHLPVLLGPDRKKLSKRHGDTALREYRDELFLPEALRNFFALLAWYPEDGRELFRTEELIERFDIRELKGASPVFDRQKLVWMNGEYLRQLRESDPDRLVGLVTAYLVRQGLLAEPVGDAERALVRRVIGILGDRLKVGSDLLVYADFFFLDRPRYDPQAVAKHLAGAQELLLEVRAALESLEPFTADRIEQALRALAEASGLGMRAVVHPVRVALTGRMVGPGLFELMEVLGKERVLRRLEEARSLAGAA
jgi:glutamyl-tRNA synthetase